MDPIREAFSLIVGQPVEDIERSLEQGFPDHPPIHPCPVLPVIELHRRVEDGCSAFRDAGRRSGRRAGG